MAAPGCKAAGGGPGDRAAARAVPGMQRWRRRGLGALCAGLCAGSELWSHAWTLPAEGRRRDVLCVGPAVGLAATPWSLPASAAEKTALQLRFNGTEVDKLPSGYIPGWGPDDLYYPEWMEGRWRVEQTLESYAAPLGKQFLANGQSAVANKVLSEQQNQLGKTVDFELRYLRTQRNNIVEDRAYNTRAKLNAFAGREVVKNVEYVEVQDNTRELATRAGNGESDPLRNVLVNFKGAVQKVFITAFETELSPENDIWRGVASTRTLFAAPGAGYNPLTVDEEVVTALKKTDTGVRGRLRLLGFLNPNDQLFFKAGNRAVSIADYSLKYTRIEESTA